MKLARVVVAVAVACSNLLAARLAAADTPKPAGSPTKDAALALVDTWAKAQNDGDFAAYSALYDAKFVGIKRTNDGGQKKLTLDKWKTDRKKMFKAAQKVAAEGASVAITGDVVKVGFVQRYQSGNYADHGDKALTLTTGKDGALRIVREEMLYSAPGWAADPKAELDATALGSPITARVRQAVEDPSAIASCLDETCCYEVTYTLELTDAKGKTIKQAIGGGLVHAEREIEMISPDKGDPMFEIGEGCGEVELDYRIVHDGDALIARQKFTGEYARDDRPWTTELTIKLPPGATIK
jgi:hypothetical protein